MSPKRSDPVPEAEEQPTAQYSVDGLGEAPTASVDGLADEPTAQLPPAEPPTIPLSAAPVAPPPDLEASGNATAGLMTSASSDRCSNCGAQLAPDQHYCVVCGERRGRPRFAGAMFAPTPAPEPVPVAYAGTQGRPTRWPPTATLIAGVATLLVAMGLGILIGHDSSNNKPVQSQPKVNVTVNGGGGGTSAGSSTGASTTASSGSNSTSSKSTKATKTTTTPKVTAAAQQKSAQAASKVLGASSSNTPPPTVQQGSSCTHGAGCQGGKFTGNFFGGG